MGVGLDTRLGAFRGKRHRVPGRLLQGSLGRATQEAGDHLPLGIRRGQGVLLRPTESPAGLAAAPWLEGGPQVLGGGPSVIDDTKLVGFPF